MHSNDCWLIYFNSFYSFNSNRKFAQLYTEDLTDATAKDFSDAENELFRVGWEPFYKMRKEEDEVQCVKTLFEVVKKGDSLFGYLERLYRLNWQPGSESNSSPTYLEAVDILAKLMDQLKINADGQTFAFAEENAEEVYECGLILPKKFKFLTKGLDRVGPRTRSMVIYDQFMPFNNKNHNEINCVTLDNLPRFYKDKGKWLDNE